MSLTRAHPYIPNSAPEVKAEMLAAIGAGSADELYAAIPERLRFAGPLAIEPAVGSEAELRRRLEGLLDRNVSARDRVSFLGGGCWPHYVPAVVDEILARGEFLTAYYGETYSDHGKLQAFFEYASMVGDLVECDVVSQPTYDWGSAAASAILMAGRLTGRRRALVPALLSPERRSIIVGTLGKQMDDRRGGVRSGDRDDRPGGARRGARRRRRVRLLRDAGASSARSSRDAPGITERAHAHGALAVVGVDADLAGRARGAAALRRRPGLRRAAGRRHPHALRRRHDRLHRQRATRSGSSPSTRRSWSARRGRSRTSGASARCAGTGWRTSSAARRATSPARRSACGRSASRVYLALLGPDGHARPRRRRSCSAASTRRSGWARSRACARRR